MPRKKRTPNQVSKGTLILLVVLIASALVTFFFLQMNYAQTKQQLENQQAEAAGKAKKKTVVPGDCNGNGVLNRGDIDSINAELFDGDGELAVDVGGGTFPGSPLGCDANGDGIIDAGDVSCTALLLNGDSCGSTQTVQKGDCDGNFVLDQNDLAHIQTEIFDGDGELASDVADGTFVGNPVGCDPNMDSIVDAGDISCATLLLGGEMCQ